MASQKAEGLCILEDCMPRWSMPGIALLVLALTTVMAPIVNTAKVPLEGDIYVRARLFGELFARTELFFGSAKPDGSTVTEEEFRLFLGQQVTPRFPDGLTLVVGLGQFRDVSGVIMQERSIDNHPNERRPVGDCARVG
jgi:hypothetical protein